MEKMNELIKLAVDSVHGSVSTYSNNEAAETIREALIEMNGGKTALDYKSLRNGQGAELFAFVEEVLANTVPEGLTGNEFFNTLVDYRNVALGDSPLFYIGDNTLFVVAEAAEGTQGIRRQRLSGITEKEIQTKLHIVRIYEEMNRILAGRVDFPGMVAKVQESFKKAILQEIFDLWTGITADMLGGATYFPGAASAGTYDEDTLLDLVANVEASANGKPATILCTKKTARKLAPSIQGADSKSDLYNDGYYGKFYGTPVLVTPQFYKAGTTEFALADDVVTVIAGDEKPIKFVYEGDPLVIMHDPTTNADLTQEYVYADRWGAGIVTAGNAGIGQYKFT